jgi:hypothetical protein
VPSFTHEVLVELFRRRASLARELLRACAGIDLPGRTAELRSVDLSQVAPPEYRADAVVVLSDDRPRWAIVVEIQLQIDGSKRRSWPVYVTATRAIHDCQAILLVIAPDEAVARWARDPIDVGHPGFRLAPVVVSYADVPRISDPEAAWAIPEMAVLSAIAHADVGTATTALAAIDHLDEDEWTLYSDLILNALPLAAGRILEAMMTGYQFPQSEFWKRILAERKKETDAAREEGREEGQILAIVEIARLRLGGALTAADETKIRRIRGRDRIDELLAAIEGIRDAAELRAVLDDLDVER